MLRRLVASVVVPARALVTERLCIIMAMQNEFEIRNCYGVVGTMLKRTWQTKVVMSVLVALISLIGFGEFLPHTDDGCAVESHCLACRAHISGVTSLAVSSSIVLAAREATRIERVEIQLSFDEPAALRPPGRAPPLPA